MAYYDGTPGSSGNPASSPVAKDLLPSQQGWLHELARAEVHPEMDRFLNGGAEAFNPHQVVEESAIDFLTGLRECFGQYAKIFNSYSEAGGRFQEIKIYGIANTAADFMIYRNQIKLMVANTAHGVIQIAFAQHIRGTLAINGQLQGAPESVGLGTQSQELVARVGPFRDVDWTFQGERVHPEQVAKFYFGEFVRTSRETRRASRGGNQLLLDQIKALLQEKGLEL
jgi:hypothetical protein